MLEANNLCKEFSTPTGCLKILKGVSLSLNRGDALSIMGPSGGGKSTLLFLLGILDLPTSGQLQIDGQNPFDLDDRSLAKFRNANIGFIFQDHCLLPQCSVLENVLVPTLVSEPDDYRKRAEMLIERVGLRQRMDHRPAELSGGEKQRVAIARALICNPRILLCDEPTGNLDYETSASIGRLLLELDSVKERVLIVVTHSIDLAKRFPLRMTLVNGLLNVSG